MKLRNEEFGKTGFKLMLKKSAYWQKKFTNGNVSSILIRRVIDLPFGISRSQSLSKIWP